MEKERYIDLRKVSLRKAAQILVHSRVTPNSQQTRSIQALQPRASSEGGLLPRVPRSERVIVIVIVIVVVIIAMTIPIDLPNFAKAERVFTIEPWPPGNSVCM